MDAALADGIITADVTSRGGSARSLDRVTAFHPIRGDGAESISQVCSVGRGGMGADAFKITTGGPLLDRAGDRTSNAS